MFNLNIKIIITFLVILHATTAVFFESKLNVTTDNINHKLITTIAFPAIPTDDSQPNPPRPCFLFQGNAEFIIAYADAERNARLIHVQVPQDSFFVSGNCSSDSTGGDKFASISGVFNSTLVARSPDEFYHMGNQKVPAWVTCGLDLNFSQSYLNSEAFGSKTLPNSTYGQVSVPTKIAFSRLDSINITCNIEGITVQRNMTESSLLVPIGKSYTCGRAKESAKSADYFTRLNISPDVILNLRHFRLQIFPVNATANSSVIPNSNATLSGANNLKDIHNPSGLKTDIEDPFDKYFGPAIHCPDDITLAVKLNNLNYSQIDERSTSKHDDKHRMHQKLPTKSLSDVKMLIPENADKEENVLHVRPEYEKAHPDWRNHAKAITSLPSMGDITTISTDASNTTTSSTDTTSASTSSASTSSASTTSKPSTTVTPVTTPNPITIKPDTVPQPVEMILYYNHSNNHSSPNDNRKACLAMVASITLDITYGARVHDGNKTHVQNKTVRVAVPRNANISGDCGYLYTPSSFSEYTSNRNINGIQIYESQKLKIEFDPSKYPHEAAHKHARHSAFKGKLNQDIENNNNVMDEDKNFNEPWIINMEFITPKNGPDFKNGSHRTDDKNHYYALHSIQVTYNTHLFLDAVRPETIYRKQNDETLTHKYFGAHFNKTLVCSSDTKLGLFGPNLSLNFANLKFHPFIPKNFSLPHSNNNTITSIDQYFTNVWICSADRLVSDMVPIAVGSALAVLILVVVIAYLIGRRQRIREYFGGGVTIAEGAPGFWARLFRRGSDQPGVYQPID